jgi:uncharacterized membrane protein
MPLWLIPMVYTIGSVIAGLILPRVEHEYLAAYVEDVSVGAALAFFSSVSSGMMALTAIVFAIAFVVVQFGAVAYSPRLAVAFSSSRTIFHSLGVFFATFTYSLVALIWTDRGGSGKVPLFSSLLVAALLILSMIAFARLVQSLINLQIHNVLQVIGARGRSVIRAMFPLTADDGKAAPCEDETASGFGPVTQTLTYSGEPRVIAKFDLPALARLAESTDGVVSIECGVGETLVQDTVLLRVHGAERKLPEYVLMRAIHLATSRTFEQDPKYAIRLLVDIAIKALSPAINDPTTAVQALDQIEDLLRRLGRRNLDNGCIRDATGRIRVTFPVPTWQDYLALSFDEIRQYGEMSLQVNRRLRAALVGLGDSIVAEERRVAVRQYLEHLDLGIGRSNLDEQDRAAALQEDRQGLGLPRRGHTPIAPQKVVTAPNQL